MAAAGQPHHVDMAGTPTTAGDNLMSAINRRWVVTGSLVGLIVALCCLFAYSLFGTMFGRWTVIVWPTSIVLLYLEGARGGWFSIVSMWSIAILLNVALYAAVAAGLSALFFIIRPP
jgi:hypothetical protein